jgi:hypothetical protein
MTDEALVFAGGLLLLPGDCLGMGWYARTQRLLDKLAEILVVRVTGRSES